MTFGFEPGSEHFRAAFEKAPDGMALNALDGRWLEVNDAFCELVGYTQEQLRELTIADLTHPDDAKASHERWLRRLGGAPDANRIEKRYVRADGSTVWVAVSSTLVRDDAGEPVYTVAHIEDITERRRAQKALEEAEERFRRAFDDAPIGMGLVDLDGRWLQVNRPLCEITGYSESELLGRTFQDITHAQDLADDVGQSQRLVDGEISSYTMEKRYVRANGALVWVMLSVSLVRDADGTPLHFVSQIEDIGDRRQAQAEMARLLTLEREHVERLRALDTMKDEFVASVSHELRTPLTSIHGYLELLLDDDAGELTEEQRTFLSTVSRNSERLLRLVGELLLVAQVDAGKLELVLDELDFGALVRESVESARPCAEAKGIHLEVSADAVPPLDGDRVRLGQLLDNVVSNALKFTTDGGRVEVSLTHRDGSAVLEVSDTGIGIPAGEQAQVFQRFFRSTAATERAIQGTGLGRSIARAIAASHGGGISFESIEGAGTTFRVDLPLAVRSTRADPNRVEEAA